MRIMCNHFFKGTTFIIPYIYGQYYTINTNHVLLLVYSVLKRKILFYTVTFSFRPIFNNDSLPFCKHLPFMKWNKLNEMEKYNLIYFYSVNFKRFVSDANLRNFTSE